MLNRQATVMESLRSVQDFIESNTNRLGQIRETGAYHRLVSMVHELDTHAANQTGKHIQAAGLTQRHRVLRRALMRDHMIPIARIARAEMLSRPEIGALRMPRGNPTAEQLATHALGMAEAAEPLADVFIDFGRPKDFLARFRAAVTAMLDALDDRTLAKGAQVAATMGLRVSLSAARRVVHVIDAYVRSELVDDAPLLDAWKTVSRVRRLPGGRSIAQRAPVGQIAAPITDGNRLLPAPRLPTVFESAPPQRVREALPAE